MSLWSLVAQHPAASLQEPVLNFSWEHPKASVIPWRMGLSEGALLEMNTSKSGGMAVWFTRSCVQNVSCTSHQARGHCGSGKIHSLFTHFFPPGKLSLLPTFHWTALGRMSPTAPQLTIDFQKLKCKTSNQQGCSWSYDGTLKSQLGKNEAQLT